MTSLTLPSARQTEFAVIASVVGFVALAAVAAVAAGGASSTRHTSPSTSTSSMSCGLPKSIAAIVPSSVVNASSVQDQP